MEREFDNMNEIVKYHNNLNSVNLRKWTSEEMNFFFTIIAKVRDNGTKLVLFNSDELKELAGFANEHTDRWIDVMESVSRKVIDLKYFEKTESKFIAMNLFSYFEVNSANKTVEVEVASKFEYVVNKLEAQFTRYELEEFTNIRSTYAKTMYRFLKQWRTLGKKEYKVDELRQMLDVPDSYSSGEVTRRVIEPIKKELKKYFGDFKCKVVKSNKRGNPVSSYEFTWKPEKSGQWIENKYDKESMQSNVPTWSQSNYKASTSQKDLEELEKRKRQALDRLRKSKEE